MTPPICDTTLRNIINIPSLLVLVGHFGMAWNALNLIIIIIFFKFYIIIIIIINSSSGVDYSG